jgi:undecaprenyl pyrophosphate phosphatase UppP
MLSNFIKVVGTLIFASISAALQAVMPLIILALAFVIADCITAWRLSRRVHKNGCHNGKKGSCGKFKSHKMAKAVIELIIVIPFGLLLAYFTQIYLFEGINIRLPQIFAGVVIFWQLWSILENESSCNDAKWAKVLQKILVDKTARHFDVDLSELEK